MLPRGAPQTWPPHRPPPDGVSVDEEGSLPSMAWVGGRSWRRAARARTQAPVLPPRGKHAHGSYSYART